MGEGLLVTARRLARSTSTRPRQDDLKRAISTSYYALFHEIARNNADRLIGASARRPQEAWRHTYRAMDHKQAKAACGQLRALRFDAGLITVGDVFRSLQEKRLAADYDPAHRVTRADALAAIAAAEQGIAALKSASGRDQTAFAAHLLFKPRAG